MLLQNTTVVNHSSTIITKYTEYTCMKESKIHYQTKEDVELWVLLIKGDKLALEIMYRRYFPHLLNYGHTISTNEELIKDCIQDLFVNVFNNSKFRPIDHVKSYLYTALRNNLVYKMSSMKETYQLENAEFEIPLTDDELEGLFAHDDTYLERSKLLKEAYRKLSANQRHAVYLYYIKELTWEEVAEILGITVHSSMNLIGIAIVKLRRLFENK